MTAEEITARGYNLDIKNPHTEEEDYGDPETLLEELKSAEAEVISVRDQLEGHPDGGAVAVSVDRLFVLYDRVAEAPNAVGRLRRFVLDLAVRGKLVEQGSSG